MRKSKISAEEMEASLLAEDKRKKDRANAFGLMSVRDRGWVELQNGAVMEWPVVAEPEDYVPRSVIPEGSFLLHIKGETYAFDTDEFRKFLRWA